MKVLRSLVLFLCFLMSLGQNPGVQIKVNSRGIDLARTVASEKLEELLRDLHIQDQSFGRARISGFHIKDFDVGATRATTLSPNRFRVSTTGARISARSSVRYKLLFTIGGIVSAEAKRVHVKVDFLLGRSAFGRPTLSGAGCVVSVGDFDVTLSGSFIAKILNRFTKYFQGPIRRKLESLACTAINKFITRFNQNELETLDVFSKFAGFKLNLAQVRNPQVTSSGITAFFNGQIFSRKQSRPPSLNFKARDVPTLPASSKMAQIMISDYVLDSLLHTIWKDGRLELTLSQDQVDNILGGAGQSFVIPLLNPNQGFQIQIFAISPPNASISTTEISVSTPFTVDIRSGPAETLQSFNVELAIQAKVQVSSSGITIRKQRAVISELGGGGGIAVPLQAILSLIKETNLVNDQFLAIYDSAMSGFQLFEKFDYYFRNSMVKHANGYIIVGSDFIHSPSGRSKSNLLDEESIRNLPIEGN